MSNNQERNLPDEIEFKMLDSKPDGVDEVVFKIEDGSTIRIRVHIDRVGVATNYNNPDGSQHYNVQASMPVNVISSDRKYTISKPGINKNKSVTSKPYK